MMPPLVSVASALRRAAPEADALPHISLAVSSFLDVSVCFSLEKAAASGSVFLFRRVLSRLQQSTPPIDEFLMISYLCKSMTAAVRCGHLPIVQGIHDAHPGKLSVKLLRLAAENGDIAMLHWLLENRYDERCVPCPQDREIAIQLFQDVPGCCLRSVYTAAMTHAQFGVIKWLVESRYGGLEHLEYAAMSAARAGDLDTIKLLHERNLHHAFNDHVIKEAARGGHTKIVTFLLENRPDRWTVIAEQFAIIGGHTEMLQLLQSSAHQLRRLPGRMTLPAWVWFAAEKDRFDLVRESLVAEPSTHDMDQALEYACMHGKLDLVKWIVESDAEAVSSASLCAATRTNQLPVLQWFHDQDEDICAEAFDEDVVNFAAQCGHLHIIQWLHQHYSGAFTHTAMDVAATHGHLEVVQWLHFNRTEGCSDSAIDGAAREGHLHVIQWLHAHRTEGCTVHAMDVAAMNGHHAVVKWLHEHRTEGCTTKAMNSAAANGDLELVMWLHQHRVEGCTSYAMDTAPLHVLKWLHFNRTEGCTPSAMDWAAKNGDLAKLQFLHAHRSEGCTFRAMVGAIKSDHLYILQWFRHHRPQDFDLEQITEEAEGHEGIKRWLRTLH